jgi:hypothetical protein
MINVGVLLFAYFAVRLAPSAEMVGLSPRGQDTVGGGILAGTEVETLA